MAIKDQHGNPVTGASVVAKVGLQTCTVTTVGGGVYRVRVPYQSTQFTIQITCSKASYKDGANQFDVYVDPMVVDSTAPSISGLQVSPAEPTASDSVTVTASIADALTGVAEATLFYSTNGGTSWASMQMVLVSGSIYRCTISVQTAGVQVLYYIHASDGAANAVATTQYSLHGEVK